jgi:hypothetical protein
MGFQVPRAGWKGGLYLWSSLQEGIEKIPMLPPARAVWAQSSAEDRAVLDYAFRDAISNPHRVGDLQIRYYRVNPSGAIIELHSFRFGYAHFVVILTERAAFLYDLWLDDEIAVAAE